MKQQRKNHTKSLDYVLLLCNHTMDYYFLRLQLRQCTCVSRVYVSTGVNTLTMIECLNESKWLNFVRTGKIDRFRKWIIKCIFLAVSLLCQFTNRVSFIVHIFWYLYQQVQTISPPTRTRDGNEVKWMKRTWDDELVLKF